jgi:hypothetical protein
MSLDQFPGTRGRTRKVCPQTLRTFRAERKYTGSVGLALFDFASAALVI